MNIAIILATGNSVQFLSGNRNIPKDILELYKKEIIANSLLRFSNHKLIDQIVVVSNLEYQSKLESLIDEYQITKVKAVLSGGITRQASVYASIEYLRKFYTENNDNIIIHDASRVLVNDKIITKHIDALKEHEAVSTILKVHDPLIVSSDSTTLENNLNIKDIYSMQTPQSFKFDTLCSAHLFALNLGENDAIDDASLMKLFNKNVYLIKGDRMNIKPNTNDELIIVKSILEHFKND